MLGHELEVYRLETVFNLSDVEVVASILQMISPILSPTQTLLKVALKQNSEIISCEKLHITLVTIENFNNIK